MASVASQMHMFYVPAVPIRLPNIVELPVKFTAGKVRVQNGSSIRERSQSKVYRNPREDLAGLPTSVCILTIKAIRDVFSEEKMP
jgi:hypothetical protein